MKDNSTVYHIEDFDTSHEIREIMRRTARSTGGAWHLLCPELFVPYTTNPSGHPESSKEVGVKLCPSWVRDGHTIRALWHTIDAHFYYLGVRMVLRLDRPKDGRGCWQDDPIVLPETPEQLHALWLASTKGKPWPFGSPDNPLKGISNVTSKDCSGQYTFDDTLTGKGKHGRIVATLNKFLEDIGAPTITVEEGNEMLLEIDKALKAPEFTADFTDARISRIYSEEDDDQYGSCMAGHAFGEIYDDLQREGILRLAALTDDSGNPSGRALVWNISGEHYIDRLYAVHNRTNSSPMSEAISAFAEFCRREGITRTVNPNTADMIPSLTLHEGLHVPVPYQLSNYEYLPYMDSFPYFDGEDCTLNMSPCGDHGVTLRKTNGEVDYIELRGGECVDPCSVVELHDGSYALSDDYHVVELHDGSYALSDDDDVVELHDGNYALVDDVVELHDGEYALPEDVEELPNGDFTLKA